MVQMLGLSTAEPQLRIKREPTLRPPFSPRACHSDSHDSSKFVFKIFIVQNVVFHNSVHSLDNFISDIVEDEHFGLAFFQLSFIIVFEPSFDLHSGQGGEVQKPFKFFVGMMRDGGFSADGGAGTIFEWCNASLTS